MAAAIELSGDQVWRLGIDGLSDSDGSHGRIVALLASTGYSTFEPFSGLENPDPVEGLQRAPAPQAGAGEQE